MRETEENFVSKINLLIKESSKKGFIKTKNISDGYNDQTIYVYIKTICVYIGALSGNNNEIKTITWTNDEDNNEYLYSLTIKDYFTFITIIKNEYNNKTAKEE